MHREWVIWIPNAMLLISILLLGFSLRSRIRWWLAWTSLVLILASACLIGVISRMSH